MDYLNALPFEIWSEIFLQAVPFSRIPLNASDPISLEKSDVPVYKDIRELQQNRLKLLFICKSLHPLIERFLYTEVVLIGSEKINKFMETVVYRKNKVDYNDNYTKTLFIYSNHKPVRPPKTNDGVKNLSAEDESAHNSSKRSSLFSLCPKLTYLYSDPRFWREYPATLEMAGTSIRIFTIPAHTWLGESFHSLPEAMPHLEQLNILSRMPWLGLPLQISQPPTISSVHSVFLQDPYEMMDSISLVLPSLRFLSLSFDKITSRLTMDLSHYASTLVELQLISQSSAASMTLPQDLFSTCYRLQKFIFDSSTMETPRSQRANAHYQDPHQNLRALVLCMDSPKSHVYLTMNATYFAQGHFPNLSLVVCRFERAADTMELVLLTEKMRMLFTGLELRVEVQDYRS